MKKLKKRANKIESLENILIEKNDSHKKQAEKLNNLKENMKQIKSSKENCTSISQEATILIKSIEKMKNLNHDLRCGLALNSNQDCISVTMTDSEYSLTEYKKKLDSLRSEYQDMDFQNKIMREKIIDAENDVFIVQSLLENTKLLTSIVERGKKWDNVVCNIEENFYRQQKQALQDLKSIFTLGEKVNEGKCHRCFQNLALVPTVTPASGPSFCLWCNEALVSKYKNSRTKARRTALCPGQPAKESNGEFFPAVNFIIVPWYPIPYLPMPHPLNFS